MSETRVLVPPSDAPVSREEVEEQMASLGLTRAQFARALGVHEATLFRWLSGDRQVEQPRMWRWAIQAIRAALVPPGSEPRPGS